MNFYVIRNLRKNYFVSQKKMEDGKMKKKLVVVLLTAAMSMSLLAGCGGNSGSSDAKSDAKTEDTKEDSDQAAADKVAKLIDDDLSCKCSSY